MACHVSIYLADFVNNAHPLDELGTKKLVFDKSYGSAYERPMFLRSTFQKLIESPDLIKNHINNIIKSYSPLVIETKIGNSPDNNHSQ